MGKMYQGICYIKSAKVQFTELKWRRKGHLLLLLSQKNLQATQYSHLSFPMLLWFFVWAAFGKRIVQRATVWCELLQTLCEELFFRRQKIVLFTCNRITGWIQSSVGHVGSSLSLSRWREPNLPWWSKRTARGFTSPGASWQVTNCYFLLDQKQSVGTSLGMDRTPTTLEEKTYPFIYLHSINSFLICLVRAFHGYEGGGGGTKHGTKSQHPFILRI